MRVEVVPRFHSMANLLFRLRDEETGSCQHPFMLKYYTIGREIILTTRKDRIVLGGFIPRRLLSEV